MTFPVDDLTLAALEHALEATYDVDDEGRLVISPGFDFDIPRLLEAYSGSRGTSNTHAQTSVRPTRFSVEDVCLALIAEIRRLRAF